MIKIIAGGRKHLKWVEEAVFEYEKRLKKPFDVVWELIEEEKHFCINEFIYQEILQGSKDEKEFAVLKSYLINVPLYSLKRGIQSFENAALLNFRCRRKGVTIRSTVDLLIAETAIENNIPLLHDDDDFANMARIITELKLVV